MSLNQLKLTINPEGWRLFTERKSNAAFIAAREKVFARDQHTCQFCGFQTEEFQEVVNLDQNYRNNSFANLVTACCFCAQCFFVESVGQDVYGGASLIYCPELEQVQINSMCHVLFCAIAKNPAQRDLSQSIYRTLKFRSQPVEEKFGEGTADPAVFGQSLFEADITSPELLSKIFEDLRLLPSRAKFRAQIERWVESTSLVGVSK